MRIFSYSLILIAIVVIGIILLGTYWTYYRSAPDYDASIQSEFLSDDVTLNRDNYGVPYIDASSERDAYFAMGYAHAQDRLWQLTVQQLIIQGRFSEFFGEDALDMDIFARFLNLEQLGAELIQQLSREELDLLEAYTGGINRYIDQGSRDHPLEFSITDVEPIRWEAHHVLAMFRLKAWNKSTAEANLISSLIGEHIPENQWSELFPDARSTPQQFITDIDEQPVLNFVETSRKVQKTLGWEPTPSGSNAWVIPPDQTVSGYPILAADPHGSLSIPSPWYEMVVRIDGEPVSGMTLPGIPAFFIGRNNNSSWAITNAMVADTEFVSYPEWDMPLESFSFPLTGDSLELNSRREIIELKEGSERMITLYESDDGPIINRVFDDATSGNPVAMNWQGFHSDQEFSGWRKLSKAHSSEQIESVADELRGSPVHILYADHRGNTGHLVTGDVPQFHQQPGFRAYNDAYEANQVYNEALQIDNANPDNFLINANNLFTIDDGYQPGHFFEPSSRVERISYLLDENDGAHTFELSKKIQQDLTSHYAAEIGSVILPILEEYETDPEIEQALQYLQNWNYDYRPNATAATVFEHFMIEFGNRIFGRVLNDQLLQAYFDYDFFTYKAIKHILTNGSILLDPALDDENVPAEPAIVESMRSAINSLNNNISPQPFEWGWENVHNFEFTPFIRSSIDSKLKYGAPYSLVEQNLLVRGPYSLGGHSTTINQGKYNWNRPFTMTHGTSARFITNMQQYTYNSVLSTGQSGNPFSSYYDDQISLWRMGAYRIVHPNAQSGEITTHTMKLLPE